MLIFPQISNTVFLLYSQVRLLCIFQGFIDLLVDCVGCVWTHYALSSARSKNLGLLGTVIVVAIISFIVTEKLHHCCHGRIRCVCVCARAYMRAPSGSSLQSQFLRRTGYQPPGEAESHVTHQLFQFTKAPNRKRVELTRFHIPLF
jgi:hypothetical protein